MTAARTLQLVRSRPSGLPVAPEAPADLARLASAIDLARAHRIADLEEVLGTLLACRVTIVLEGEEGGAPPSAPHATLTHGGMTVTHGRTGRALSPRLRAVVALILDGRSDKEVALALGVRLATARTYVQRLFRALGVSGRGEVLRMARRVCPPS